MQPQLISDSVRRAARLYGTKPAVVDGDTRYDYAELARRCRSLGGGLSALGVSRGDRVAVLMANGHRYLEALLGVPSMGAVVVPMNNRLAVPEHRYILEDAGAKVLLADAAHAEVAKELAGSADHVVLAPDGYDALLESGAEVEPPTDLGEDELAGLFYTGGTTGAAKGVMLSHRNLVANALHISIALGYRDSDVYLHCAPMFHLADGASTLSVTWVGGTHVFVPSFEPGAVLDVIERDGVTNTLMVPTMLAAVNAHPASASADLSSMHLVLHGAAPIATELLRESIKVFGCSFAQGYGMTEAAPLLTVLLNEEELVDSERLKSAGREIVGVEVNVRRPDGSRCDAGEVGEVVARGPNFMAGYWNKPEATEAATKDGWYWTQDLGYLDDEGYLFLVDRAKDMIISGGENVYSIEVEEAIMAHPSVMECAVIGVPDDKWGERVHAAVVLKDGQALDEAVLLAHCKELIAGFKCPRSVEFLDELPRSGAGKILKRDIRDRHWSGHSRGIH